MGFKFTYEATLDRGEGKEPLHLFYLEDGYAEVYPALNGGIVLDLSIVEENEFGADTHHPLPVHLVAPVGEYLWKNYREEIEDAAREYRQSGGVVAEALRFGANAHHGPSPGQPILYGAEQEALSNDAQKTDITAFEKKVIESAIVYGHRLTESDKYLADMAKNGLLRDLNILMAVRKQCANLATPQEQPKGSPVPKKERV